MSRENASAMASPRAKAAKNAGKHPIHKGGHRGATTDPVKIRNWWRKHPRANIGLNCEASGVVVVDRDPRNGSEATWAALEEKHGKLESDVAAFTGGGGRHEFFAPPGETWQPIEPRYRQGIDIKYRGYVVLAPSRHKSGKNYCWVPDADPFSRKIDLVGFARFPSYFIKSGSSTEPGTGSSQEPREGADAQERLNCEALNHIRQWAPDAYPDGKWSSGDSWRVESENLGRDYQEALVIHPYGVRDHGPDCG